MKKRVIKKEKKIFFLILAIFMVAVLLFFAMKINKDYSTKKVEAKEVECYSDKECLVIKGGCCPCEKGGSPRCIPQTKLFDFSKMLEKCSPNGSCFNEDCGKISCSCTNNKCIGKRI